jgi:hypothetical protein
MPVHQGFLDDCQERGLTPGDAIVATVHTVTSMLGTTLLQLRESDRAEAIVDVRAHCLNLYDAMSDHILEDQGEDEERCEPTT